MRERHASCHSQNADRSLRLQNLTLESVDRETQVPSHTCRCARRPTAVAVNTAR